MNDARLAESAVSIVVNIYTGILQGIPNLLNILTESKESSYYHDVLVRDIEFTQNAVTIAADDVSARVVEVKLQEKGIPFDKVPASLLEEHIKANGRHIFLARELDFERIIEAVQEVKAELSPKNHDVELEFEEGEELEREAPESGAEEEQGEALPDAPETEEPDENQDEGSQEPEEKKHTAKKAKHAYSPQQEPFKDSGREGQIERRRAQEHEQQRYDEERRARNQTDRYDRERREIKERELTKERSHTEASHWESGKKTPQECYRDPESERGHRAERADSGTANRDKSLNLSTGQFEQGKTTEQLREEENWISRGSPTEPAPGSQTKQHAGRTDGSYSSIPSGKPKEPLQPHARGDLASYHAGDKPRQAERSALAGGNRNVSVHFDEQHESVMPDPAQKPGITVLGTGHDVAQAEGQVSRDPQRAGTTLTGHARSRQAEIFSYQPQNTGHGRDMAAAHVKSYLGAEKLPPMNGRTPDGAAIAPGNTHGNIRVKRIDMKHLPLGIQQMDSSCNGAKHTERERALLDKVRYADKIRYTDNGELLQRTDRTQEILKGRRYYQVRDLLSPHNFRNAVSGSKRVVSQSIVGRDTDSGRIANEVVDYVSPAARLTKGRFLNGGAVEIARTTRCDMDVLTAAYAVKNNMSLNDAKSELRMLRKLDASLLRNGKDGLNLTNDGAAMKKIAEAYQLQGQPASFIGMLRGFDNDKFAEFISHLNVSDELREALLKTPVRDIDILKIDSLIKKHGGNLQDKKLLQMMRAGKIMERYPGAGSFSALFRRYFTKMIKELGRSSDAGRALGTSINVGRNVYHAYRSGIRLLYTVLRKFKVVDTNSIAAQVFADPGKTLGRMAVSKTRSSLNRGISRMGLQNARSVTKTKRVANHASSALKFLKNPTAPLRNILAKNALAKKVGGLISKLGSKAAVIAAKAGAILGWIAVIIIVLIILIEVFATMPGSSPDDKGTANYMFVQDTEIMQEIITELTAKNEAFISDINNAANHRGSYGTTTGLTADENVGFYESGAYNIVFRDAYGNELEPSHVDLNNTKTILAMATRFLPYPFQKPSEHASDEEKKAYEDIKQHFKDYCYFLWASTHQISIEEYHPGNSSGIEGAVDNSGLLTTLDRGTCDQNEKTIWLKADFSPDIISEQHCETCDASPATGLGAYYDDLCTHGRDGNEHGGWRKTGNMRIGVNCKAAAKGREHHDSCDHSEDDCDSYTCSPGYYKKDCSHVEYEWVYECGGHMGSVVYVTIGELSRMPSFPAASDVDYDAVGKYDTGETLSGDELSGTEAETEAQ